MKDQLYKIGLFSLALFHKSHTLLQISVEVYKNKLNKLRIGLHDIGALNFTLNKYSVKEIEAHSSKI